MPYQKGDYILENNVTFLLFATSIIPLMIGTNIISKNDKIGSKNLCFFMFCISGSVWNFGNLLIELASDDTYTNIGYLISFAGGIASGCLLIKFISILIAGNKPKKSKLVAIAILLSIIIFPLTIFMNNALNSSVPIYSEENEIVKLVIEIYVIFIISTCLIITFRWIKVSKYKRDKFHGMVIICGILFSSIIVNSSFFNIAMEVPDSFGVFILIVIIYYFSRKYNSLSITVGNLAEYIYSSANTPILVLNDNKKVELANSSAMHFFNINSKELIGRDIENIFTCEKEDDIKMFEINKSKNVSDKYIFDSTCLLNNAKCNISTTTIYDKYDEFICTIFVITDLTDKMNLIKQLNESREEAVAANKAKSAFLANMSHEIRTPMNAIIGMSEIILQKDTPNDIKDNVINIRNSGKGLLTIINDILDLSKIESGKFEIIKDEYMMPSLINDIVNIISVRLADKPIEFIVNVDPAMPNNLIGDEIRLKQILINILGNSVKFTQKGFIKLSMNYKQEQEDFYLIMKIEDSGIGIKQEDINNLFGAFNQVDTRKNRNIQGTGLGLAISKNLAELMDGNIDIESEYGKGTTFIITVKQQIKDYRPIAEIKNKEAEHIIIYEENESFRESFTYTLDKLSVKYSLCFDEISLREAVSKNNITYIFARKYVISQIQDIIKEYNINPKILVLLNMNDALGSARNFNEVYLPLFCIQVADIINDEMREFQYKQTGINEEQIIPMPFAKILIVDDNEVNLQVAKGLMNPYEMEIECAISGQEAINKMKTSKYDLVFMDHMMPGMDGVDTTKLIRNLEGNYYKEVPIVALTANALSEAREMFLSQDFNDFLAKPIELSKLNFILKKWILSRYSEANYMKDSAILDNSKLDDIEENLESNKFEENQIGIDIEKIMDIKMEENVDVVNFEVKGIELAVGLNNVGGNMEVYTSILETYYKETNSKINDLYETIKNKDIQLFITYIHGLKSSSGSIGAEEISNLAKRLEFAGKGNDLEYINNHIDEFADKTLRILENIDIFIKKKNHKEEQGLLKDIEENKIFTEKKVIVPIDKEILMKLEEAFNEVRLEDVEDLLREIIKQNYDQKTTKLITQIQENLEIFEYDNSIQLINKFLEEY